MQMNRPSTGHVPRTVKCRRCGGRMNLTGRGQVPGSVRYCCGGCPEACRFRVLWLGTVTKTGTQGLGSLAIGEPGENAAVDFRKANFFTPSRDGEKLGHPEVGVPVLVELAESTVAGRVWNISRGAAIDRRMSAQPAPAPESGNSARSQGVVERLGGPTWGYVSVYRTGDEVFVHKSQWLCPMPMVPGVHVSFRTITTNKGLQAIDVRPLQTRGS